MSIIKVHPQTPVTVNGVFQTSVAIDLHPGSSQILYYQVPEQWSHAVDDRADAFLVALLFKAMALGRNIHIDGAVSPSLVRNLYSFMELMGYWFPDHCRIVDITAADTTERQTDPDNSKAVCAFSAGVDSCFTAYRHRKLIDNKYSGQLEAGVVISGHDIHHQDYIGLSRLLAVTGPMLASIGLQQITVVTNMREFSDHRWYLAAGAGVSSCLMILGGYYRIGIMAATGTYNLLAPHAFSPLISPMLSSRSFTHVQDGGAHSRIDKIGFVSRWPEAMQLLRVCWETRGEAAHRNCGKCGKCLRTALGFMALGLRPPVTLPASVTPEQVTALKIDDTPSIARVQLEIMQDILARATANGLTDPWVDALQHVMDSRRSVAAQGLGDRD